MRKHEIRIGGLYTARVSGRFVTMRVDNIRSGFGTNQRDTTLYDVTNLTTGRRTTFRSAAKFRAEVKPADPTSKGAESSSTASESAPSADSASGSAIDHPADEDDEVLPDRDPTPPLEEPGTRGPHDVGEVRELVPEAFEGGKQCSDPTSSRMTIPAGVSGAVAGSLAAKIAAAQSAPTPTTGLTRQQQDILAAAREIEAARGNGQRVLVIGAGAGTGKTFTLKQLEQVLSGNGQYTAFNSSLVAESKAKFKRAACNTTHSLAFRAVGKQFAHRLNGARVRSWEIASRLGIEDFYVELPASLAPPEADGKPQTRRLKAAFLAGQVTVAVRRFCQSADAEIVAKHFTRFDGIDEAGKYDNSDKVKSYLLPFARKAWADLTDPNGSTMPFSHDVYVKLWQMGQGRDRPVIAADYILLDEAQDTAPVMLSILQQQTHALLILVGDDNQQIYEWRGAVNAMGAFPGAPRRLLSQSFRFGQTVADVANAVLAGLEVPTDLVMSGLPTIPTRVGAVKEPRCYLYRTNAGAIGRLMQAMDEGKRGHLIGGTSEVVAFCRAAIDLQNRRGTTHPELGCFNTWAEVQEYSKEDEGQDLRLMVKLIDDFKADRIIAALEDMPPEDEADLILSTAHRSKGREWASVRLGQDFPTANKLTDADRRLVYVAATRAQEELDLTVCPTFCGGFDRTGTSGGEEGRAEWIPGIEITYTVPMPTEDDLAAYRESKSAAKPAAAAPEPPAGQTTALPAPDAARAAVGPANGNSAAPGKPEMRDAAGNTWTKGRDGNWLVRGPVGQQGTVTVTRKNGTTSRETIRRVVWQDASVALYEV